VSPWWGSRATLKCGLSSPALQRRLRKLVVATERDPALQLLVDVVHDRLDLLPNRGDSGLQGVNIGRLCLEDILAEPKLGVDRSLSLARRDLLAKIASVLDEFFYGTESPITGVTVAESTQTLLSV